MHRCFGSAAEGAAIGLPVCNRCKEILIVYWFAIINLYRKRIMHPMEEAVQNGCDIGFFAGQKRHAAEPVHIIGNVRVKADVAYIGYILSVASNQIQRNGLAVYLRLYIQKAFW